MEWEKKGLIFGPGGKYEWSKSHAQVPVVDLIGDKWRIYYATRNSQNNSYTSYIEVEAGNPRNILYVHDSPILTLGRLGSFDEHGIMPSSIIDFDGKKYLYYIGWSQRKSVPYQNSIGLAISSDGGRTFEKFSEGPIIGVNHIDPFFTGTIFVLKEDNYCSAYYLSCVEWKLVNEKPEPLYVIKYADSKNGIHWNRNNIRAISFKDEQEGGLVSASVIKRGSKYFMWFGYRKFYDFRDNANNSYRIGFATSDDGKNWLRNDDESGIGLSEDGWDSQMISYPNVVESGNKMYLFYNGNHFGKQGFGYAVSDSR